MKYIDEYRNRDDIKRLADRIGEISTRKISLMEVCGGHTMAIHRFGIHSFLPDTIDLISAPGCPVCVTATSYVDRIVALSRLDDVIIATYGDFIRVPGSTSSLEKERARGADIRIVYSTLDALTIAREEKNKRVIFPGIGFETTAPASAAAVLDAEKGGLNNFMILSTHKRMPPAMAAIIDEGVTLNGYICPGHVSAIAGSAMYNEIVDKYKLPCVVSGFEPSDMLLAIYMLAVQIENDEARVEIAYSRAVKPEGNIVAIEMMDRVFEKRDDVWRGLGNIKDSGLGFRDEFKKYDASLIQVEVEETIEPAGCLCGEILKGLKKPVDCPLFREVCTPENPVGACMVSNEGACAAYYRYRDYE